MEKKVLAGVLEVPLCGVTFFWVQRAIRMCWLCLCSVPCGWPVGGQWNEDKRKDEKIN